MAWKSLRKAARDVDDLRWRAVLPLLGQFSDPIVTTPALVTLGDAKDQGGHAFLATGDLAVTVTEQPSSEERPLVNVVALGTITGVGLDASHRLVLRRGEDAMTLNLYPSEFSQQLLLGLRERWERITGGSVSGDWSLWERGVVRTEAWRRVGA